MISTDSNVSINDLLVNNYDLIIDDKVALEAKMLYVALFNLNQTNQTNADRVNFDISQFDYLSLINSNSIRKSNIFSMKEFR